MDRRALLVLLGVGALAAPPRASGQQARKTPRVGFMHVASLPDIGFDTCRQGLRDLGYVEGRNIVFERPQAKSYEEAAAALERLKLDVVVALSTPASLAAKEAISGTPVVFVTFADPVRSGLVASLAHPGGNMTGLTMTASELEGKRMQLLREMLPRAKRVAVLWNPASSDVKEQLDETLAAARSLGLTVDVHEVTQPQELDSAFAAMARARADALFMLSDRAFFSERARITALAGKARLPAIYHWRAYVESGGLMSYGPNLVELYRRAAIYVDRILKGAKPADVPVEQPTKYELVINLKAAKALGLTIPPPLRAKADEVIE